MPTTRPLRARDCRKVKHRGQTWYCCCGQTRKPIKGRRRPACACAPMVGKKVDSRRTVKFWIDGKGKAHRMR